MDILETLKLHGEELIKEDFDFFEIELATGQYSKEYITECHEIMEELRKWKMSKPNTIIDGVGDGYTKIEKRIDPMELPEEEREKQLKKKINNCRSQDGREKFISLIFEYKINEKFVDENFAFFKHFELSELLKYVEFSESFLEKYFNLLDSNAIAEFQLYSEEFFMKHYSKMDYSIVLKKSKNPWKDKNKRSSKLNIFLKLKGVSI